jgi:hypothetical protein
MLDMFKYCFVLVVESCVSSEHFKISTTLCLFENAGSSNFTCKKPIQIDVPEAGE